MTRMTSYFFPVYMDFEPFNCEPYSVLFGSTKHSKVITAESKFFKGVYRIGEIRKSPVVPIVLLKKLLESNGKIKQKLNTGWFTEITKESIVSSSIFLDHPHTDKFQFISNHRSEYLLLA